MTGKTISHYKILSKLGEGGMGIVYKAEDTKLDRIVALKFLPCHLTANDTDKARFIQEAKAAAALNHPNVCVIHDIQEHDSQQFIVMEYVEGQTLRDRIKDERLKIKETIDYAIQTAEALRAAHAKDIIHRDIKSENIMVTSTGQIKVMDFGLAKLRGSVKLTKTSTTAGTLAYSSPEQIQGQKVDIRSDIFSFGVVLYEMLTGQLPFKGEYESAVIYSILDEEPEPVSHLRSGVSDDLERIIHKALIKNPDDRYQHTDEMLVDLRSCKKEKALRHATVNLPKSIPRPLWGTLGIILIFTLLLIGYLLTRREDRSFQIKHTLPLTSAPGLEQDPAWSPEGSRIAYASDESGNMDIWVQQVAAAQKLNLTKDYKGFDGKPAWSPDGEWIAFVSDRNGGGIFMVPALGGIPKRILSLPFAPSLSYLGAIPTLCWSPDGTRIAYSTKGAIYTIMAIGGSSDIVPLPSTGLIVGYSEPAWSPDGERFACTGFVAVGVSTSQIWSVNPNGKDLLPLTQGSAFNNNPVWSPNRRQLFFLSDRGGIQDVWWIPVDTRGAPDGSAKPLTTGVGIGAIALSKDGKKLAYTKKVERSNIWSIPIVHDRKLTLDDAVAVTSENNYIELVSVSPDGKWIAFDSNRSGNQDIWMMRKNGSELRQITTNTAHDWIGSWSPDGNQIAFHSIRSGNRDLYVIPVSGGAVTALTDHPAEDFIPRFSPDGKTIAFASNRNGNMDVWIMPSGGGDPRQLTFHEAQDFLVLWSPDGKLLCFGSKRTGRCELFLISPEGGNPVQLTHGAWTEISPRYWSTDGRIIYAYGQGGPGNEGPNLWAISVPDGSARALIDFSASLKEVGHWMSSDGERIFFPLWDRVGDLWMAELEEES